MTSISLLSIKVDSPPEQIRLDSHGLLRLEAGVHLDLTETSPETCERLSQFFANAAELRRIDTRRLEVA